MSFDVATVKLPTRKRIGFVAYARFARRNDLGNGIVVYPAVAVLALLILAAATMVAYRLQVQRAIMLPLLTACAGTFAHFLCTTQAAPNMLYLCSATGDKELLTRKLDAFAMWHALRALFQFLTFVSLVWVLAAVCGAA